MVFFLFTMFSSILRDKFPSTVLGTGWLYGFLHVPWTGLMRRALLPVIYVLPVWYASVTRLSHFQWGGRECH